MRFGTAARCLKSVLREIERVKADPPPYTIHDRPVVNWIDQAEECLTYAIRDLHRANKERRR